MEPTVSVIVPVFNSEEYLERCEREYVQYALTTYKSSYAAAAALGTSQSSIMRRKRKYSLS